ncbi:MAG: hypothetical protein ACM3O5_06075 [Betaproteobacteria bacterium]
MATQAPCSGVGRDVRSPHAQAAGIVDHQLAGTAVAMANGAAARLEQVPAARERGVVADARHRHDVRFDRSVQLALRPQVGSAQPARRTTLFTSGSGKDVESRK